MESSLSAMLGRMAMDLKREVTWDELLRSQDVWDPKLDLARTSGVKQQRTVVGLFEILRA